MANMRSTSPLGSPGVQAEVQRRVPARVLLISLAALCVPVVAGGLLPGWHEWEGGLLFMLPALIPPFLLSYHKGWKGASQALAAGMATLALVQVEALALDLRLPRWDVALSLVALLVVVSLGSGWVAEALIRDRERAQASALTDPLTGGPNRRHATVFLERVWGGVARGRPLSLVIFDLDHFKSVNDRHGHVEGDRVIRALAGVLEERTRRTDLSGRFGGEEFLSILVDCGASDAEAFAQEIRAQFSGIDFGWGRVTVSAGVATAQRGMPSPEFLIGAADQALYRAKEEGRDRVCVASGSGHTPTVLAPETVSDPSLGRDALAGLAVLLVDDEVATLRAMSRALESLGCVVRTAGCAADALEAVKEHPDIGLLVTDIVMPDMSGFTLVDLVARIRPDLPVLYVSGYPQADVYWGGTPGSRSAFLGKPVEVGDLRRAVAGLVGGDPKSPPSVQAPAAEETGGSLWSHAAMSAAVNRARILIVDDDEAMVRSLRRVFITAGHENVEGTTDAAEALRRLASGGFDLLVLDLHMPEVDGYEVLQELGALTGASEYFPVLVLTGDQALSARRKALQAGAMDFLRKPFDPAEAEVRAGNLLRLRYLYRHMATERDRMEDIVAARTAELADTRSELLHRLARAAEYRDDVTGRHAARVGLLASRIASEIGLEPRVVDLIRRTAPLHDVGKIGISDAILRKPGPLSADEYEGIKQHTVIGAEILGRSQSELLTSAKDIALSHHERWDGQGYPQGLQGEAIPLAARIVAVADTFDVVSHVRPYKQALLPEAAHAEILRCSGSHFDPRVVRAFDRISRRVGPRGLPRLADPIDPFSDTGLGPAGNGVGARA